jgi:hypothetical protein
VEKITIQIVRLDHVGLLQAVHPELVRESWAGGCACCCIGGVLGLSSRSEAPFEKLKEGTEVKLVCGSVRE